MNFCGSVLFMGRWLKVRKRDRHARYRKTRNTNKLVHMQCLWLYSALTRITLFHLYFFFRNIIAGLYQPTSSSHWNCLCMVFTSIVSRSRVPIQLRVWIFQLPPNVAKMKKTKTEKLVAHILIYVYINCIVNYYACSMCTMAMTAIGQYEKQHTKHTILFEITNWISAVC